MHALLGGTRGEILSGVSLGIEPEMGALFDRIDQFLGEGYRRIKLKIGPGAMWMSSGRFAIVIRDPASGRCQFRIHTQRSGLAQAA